MFKKLVPVLGALMVSGSLALAPLASAAQATTPAKHHVMHKHSAAHKTAKHATHKWHKKTMKHSAKHHAKKKA